MRRLTGRSRQWLGAVPAARVGAARRGLPQVVMVGGWIPRCPEPKGLVSPHLLEPQPATLFAVTDADELEVAWDAVHDATPASWYAGRPSYDDERHEWAQYAFDQREPAKVGVRSREWTADGATEVDVLREGARSLRELGAGRVPR